MIETKPEPEIKQSVYVILFPYPVIVMFLIPALDVPIGPATMRLVDEQVKTDGSAHLEPDSLARSEVFSRTLFGALVFCCILCPSRNPRTSFLAVSSIKQRK